MTLRPHPIPTVGTSFPLSRRIVGIGAAAMAKSSSHNKEHGPPVPTEQVDTFFGRPPSHGTQSCSRRLSNSLDRGVVSPSRTLFVASGVCYASPDLHLARQSCQMIPCTGRVPANWPEPRSRFTHAHTWVNIYVLTS